MSTAQLRREISHLRERRPSRRYVVVDDRVEFAAAARLPDLDPWQERLLRSDSPLILLNCARQSGKSTMAAIIALHQALRRLSSLVLILAPAERQAKELFSKVATAYQALGHIIPADSYRKMGMELANGSRIEALPGTEKTIRGFSGVDLLLVDEASRVADELYYAVRPMLAVSGGRLMMLSTPYGRRGVFYEEWIGDGAWERYEVPATECPRIPPAFLEEERQSMPEWWFAQEYLCEFRETEDQIFSHAMIESARDDELPEYRFEGDETLWS